MDISRKGREGYLNEVGARRKMSPLKTFITFELKRLMANVSRAHPEADELAVKLMVVDVIKSLRLAEVQPEDERKAG